MGKKPDLIKAGVQLFARQGYDGTTTAQIAAAVGVTEPVIYYNFKNKEALFVHILESIFTEYFARLDALEAQTPTQFQKLENLIGLHFAFTTDFPDETYIITSVCPAKLRESAHVCARLIEEQRKRLTTFISGAIKAGIASGEFFKVPVSATTGLILIMVNGLMRRRVMKQGGIRGFRKATIEFCRRSLVRM